MPKFKGKHYAYTKEGYAAYKRAKKKKRRSPKIRTFNISKTYFSK